MSNMSDVVGLRVPYGKTKAQYPDRIRSRNGHDLGLLQSERHACFSLGLMKAILAHDSCSP